MNWIKKWQKIKAEPKQVRNFGLILSGILFALGVIAFLRHHHQWKFEWPLGLVFLILNLAAPTAMVYVYKTWMLAADFISGIVLRILLGVFFFIVLTPISLVLRLLKKDVLDQQLNPSHVSYWRQRTAVEGKERYEKLF